MTSSQELIDHLDLDPQLIALRPNVPPPSKEVVDARYREQRRWIKFTTARLKPSLQRFNDLDQQSSMVEKRQLFGKVVELTVQLRAVALFVRAGPAKSFQSDDLIIRLFVGHVLNIAEGLHVGTQYKDLKFLCGKSEIETQPSRSSSAELQQARWAFYSQCRQDDYTHTLQMMSKFKLEWLAEFPWYNLSFCGPYVTSDLLAHGAPICNF